MGRSHAARNSEISVASSSHYHSADESDAVPPLQGEKESISPRARDGRNEAVATQVTPPSNTTISDTASLSSARRRGRQSKGASKRLSRFRNDIAGPPSERPLAGSHSGPIITPRKASAPREGDKKPASIHSAMASSPSTHSLPDRYYAQALPALMPSPVIPSPTSTSSLRNVTVAQAMNKHNPGDQRQSLLLEKKLQAANDDVEGQGMPHGAAAASQGEAQHAHRGALDEAALQRWVLSVGCVNFDLERGPDLEFLYPSLGISREERDCMYVLGLSFAMTVY